MKASNRWVSVPLAILLLSGVGCSTVQRTAAPAVAGSPTVGQPAPAPDSAGDAGAAVATDSRNGVEVKVTFANARQYQPEGNLAFSVALDNHALDLADLDVAQKAVLRPVPGEPVAAGFSWRQEGAGHHASGVLTWRNRDGTGQPIVTKKTESITLELRDLGAPGTWTFRFDNRGWQVPAG